jgi:multidrug resistance efflux pump
VADQVVAVLDDADYRAGEEEAQARHEVAIREQARLRAGGETAGAAVLAARLEGLRAEVDLWKDRLERTRVRSNVTGTVATPRVKDLEGMRLERGDVFCEVVDLDRQRVEIAMPEQDAGFVAPGMQVKVKLRAFPADSFLAEVERVGVAATTIEGEQHFMVQARLLDPPAEIRSGLTGLAKVNTGRASIARVAFRRPARWIWSIIWGWLP